MKYAAKAGAEAVPFVEGGKDLLGADGAEPNTLFGHRFEA